MIRSLTFLFLASAPLVATTAAETATGAASSIASRDDVTPVALGSSLYLPGGLLADMSSAADVVVTAGRELLGRRKKNRTRKRRSMGRKKVRNSMRRRRGGKGKRGGGGRMRMMGGNKRKMKKRAMADDEDKKPDISVFVDEDEADEEMEPEMQGDIAGADNVEDEDDVEEEYDEDVDEEEEVEVDEEEEEDGGPTPSATAGTDGGASTGGSIVGTTVGGKKQAHGTHFVAMGKPFGGCGVPPSKAEDDDGKPLPFTALNTNSEFANGDNCGRWVEITLGKNCEGGGNSKASICNGGKWVDDSRTGQKVYGYIMDSCADDNFWCQDDTFHLDVSKPYLDGLGLSGDNWNGRQLSWSYMDGVAPGWKMSKPKFMWKDGSKWQGNTFWATLIVYNTANGIGKVEQLIGNSWEEVENLVHLGNMFVMKRPSGDDVIVKVYDVSGSSYGEFKVDFVCNGSPCSASKDAPATTM